MKKIYVYLFCFCCIALSEKGLAQDWVWEKAIGSAGYDGTFSVAVDNGGYVIAAGFFSQPLNISGQSLNPSGLYDAFLVKYSPTGNLEWLIPIGGPGIDYIADITVDVDGNIYVLGNFEGSVMVGSTATNQLPLTSNVPYTFFVAKFGSNGVLQWATPGNYTYGSSATYPHQAFSLDIRDDGTGIGTQIIVTGLLQDVGDSDVFIVRLNYLGVLINGWRSTSFSNEIGTGVKFDNIGNIVLTGYYFNQLDLPNSTIPLTGQGYDIFVAKYTNNLSPIWQKSAGGTGEDASGGIDVDANNNIFITGLCQGGLFGTIQVTTFGGKDFYVAKYSSNGIVEWVKNGGSTGDDATSKIEVAPDGSLYLLGSFETQCNLGNGINISSNGNRDIVLVKYNPNGTVGWNTTIGGIGLDETGDVAVGNNCKIIVGGGFSNAVTLNNTITSFSGNVPDFFVTVLDVAPATPTITPNGSTALCPGGSVQLTAANACTGCTVNWYNNGQLAQSGNPITVSAPGTYTARVFNIANPSACQTSGDSNPITVTGAPAVATPNITVNGSTVLCQGGSVTLTAGNVCGTCTIYWYKDGQGPVFTGNPFIVTMAGNYTAVTTDNITGCSSNASGPVNVSLSSYVATVSVNGCNLTASAGNNYNWFVNGILIPGANSQTYTAQQSGNYSVSMTSPDGCTVASQPILVNCTTATTEGLKDLQIGLWPNPAKESVTLAFNLLEAEELTIELLSITGQSFPLILENLYTPGQHLLEVDVSNYPAGMYFVKVRNAEAQALKKLVVVK